MVRVIGAHGVDIVEVQLCCCYCNDDALALDLCAHFIFFAKS